MVRQRYGGLFERQLRLQQLDAGRPAIDRPLFRVQIVVQIHSAGGWAANWRHWSELIWRPADWRLCVFFFCHYAECIDLL